MSDSIKKVLLGAVAGALLVSFVWHAASERARRAPDAPAPAGAPKSGGAGGSPVPVIATPARIDRLALEM